MAQANTSKDVTSAPSLSQWLEIDALDTLFFRDGKPFSLGEETWADGIFPPSMSVVYGALRTAYAVQRGLKVEQVLAETAALRITDFCFYERNAYFPLPADFAEPKGKRRGKRDAERKGRYTEYVQLAPFQGLEGLLGLSGAASSLATANDIWFAPAQEDVQVEGAEGGLIAASDLEPYLAGKWLGKVKGKGLSQVVNSEAKIGIGRDRNTYTAAEGQLYRVGMRRPGDLRLRVQVAGVDFSPMPEGLLKLGGEGRAAAYRVLGHQPVLSREATFSVAAGGYFRLYLATPAICRDTWPPLDFLPAEVATQVVGACVGRPQHIGGFDLQEQRPKPMRKALPAGSVFIFRLTDNSTPVTLPSRTSVSDYGAEQGFGLAYLGPWDFHHQHPKA